MQYMIGFPNMTQTLQVTGCHIGHFPPGWEYPRHHHHLFELLCCLGGEVIQEINRTRLTLRAGDWLLINAGVRHKTTNAGSTDYVCFNVHFDLEDLDIRRLLGKAPYRLIPAHEAALTTSLSDAVAELQSLMQPSASEEGEGGFGASAPLEDKLLVQANLLLIIREMLNLIRAHGTDQPETERVTLFTADAAHAIEEKLSRGLAEDISIASVAKELNMSRSQCTKLFTKVYGLSPRQYVSRQKLLLAKELLVTSYMPVAEIAERLGFQSASHFSRQFRRWTGQSPTAFKPKHRGSGPEVDE